MPRHRFQLCSELASGNRNSHVPFGMLCKDSQQFINSKYLPLDFVWKDPRNLTKNTILHFCDHIRTRQDELGPNEGFRFHAYFDGEDIVRADYGLREDDRRAAARTKKQQAARSDIRAGGQHKGKGRAIPVTTTSNAQIDPALLTGEDSTGVTQTVNRTTHNDSGGFIGESDMQLLINKGYPSTVPANGPNDGLPCYYVSAAGINLLKQITADGNPFIDTTQMTTRSQINRKLTNN